MLHRRHLAEGGGAREDVGGVQCLVNLHCAYCYRLALPGRLRSLFVLSELLL